MTKLVELKLDGDLEKGLKVNLAISTEGGAKEVEICGNLPPALQLQKTYHLWQTNYRRLGLPSRLSAQEISYDGDGSIQKHHTECVLLGKELKQELNNWLNAPQFQPIWHKWLEKIDTCETVRILIRTSNQQLRRLPWHLWELLAKYPDAEIALAANDFERLAHNLPAIKQERISILAILGDSSDINVEQDKQLLIQALPNADLTFLCEPKRQEISSELWEKKWDILFFAGHSSTQNQTGLISINQQDSLSLEELSYSLKRAVAKGLKLAIFNSCDSLGLAGFLEQLNLPQMIVMREPVPDLVAQEFLKHFLTDFRQGKHFYLAVKQARERLQGLEGKFPGASWLPVIVQNPAIIYPNWWSLGVIPPCPYRGLSAFREEDAKFFFGREQFTSKLVARVKRDPMVAVIGASGSGKSSVVFAGLIPQLKQQHPVKIVGLRPGNNPLASLAQALKLKDSDSHWVELETEISLEQDSQSLCQIIEGFVRQNPGKRFVLVIDQFEELYTLSSPTQQQLFVNLLLNAVNNAANFCLVLTLRADFLNYAIDYPQFADALENASLLLSQMNQAELWQAITEPASVMDVNLEAGLRDKILADVAASPEKLPLLEFTLTQLWQQQIETRLTHQAYREIGGVEAALAQYAELVYTKLSPEQRLIAQKVFIQLVRISAEGSEATKRLANREEVKDWDLVVRLADERLVVTNRDISNQETVEIIHEALISNWYRLQQWINQDSSFRIWQEQLRQSLNKWKQTQRDSGGLLRGLQLAEAIDWLENREADLTKCEAEYIKVSQQTREQELQQEQKRAKRELAKEKKARRYAQIGIGVSSVIALIAVGLGFFAQKQTKIANLHAKAIEAENLISTNPVEGLVMAMAAIGQRSKSGLEQELPRAHFSLSETFESAREKQLIKSHTDSVRSVQFSPDGEIIASASEDGTVRLWDRKGNPIALLKGHTDQVLSVQFSPDGETIASVSEDGTVRLWDRKGNPLALVVLLVACHHQLPNQSKTLPNKDEL